MRSNQPNGSVVFTTPTNVGGNVSLSANLAYEFRPLGTFVGTFQTSEPGTGHSFFYSLVNDGVGPNDNSSFTYINGQLLTADAFDFAAKSSYSVRVRSTDEIGRITDQTITVNVLDNPDLTRTNRTLFVNGTGNDVFNFAAGALRHNMTLDGTAPIPPRWTRSPSWPALGKTAPTSPAPAGRRTPSRCPPGVPRSVARATAST